MATNWTEATVRFATKRTVAIVQFGRKLDSGYCGYCCFPAKQTVACTATQRVQASAGATLLAPAEASCCPVHGALDSSGSWPQKEPPSSCGGWMLSDVPCTGQQLDWVATDLTSLKDPKQHIAALIQYIRELKFQMRNPDYFGFFNIPEPVRAAMRAAAASEQKTSDSDVVNTS
ncbi:hypothetical protein PCASD_26158, partial [Puccinia coronata f. sp. avenae]